MYNIKTDYREEHNLAAQMPERVASMNAARQKYVNAVDGGSVEQARKEHAKLMDKFSAQTKEGYRKKLEALKKKGVPDFEAQKAALLAEANKGIRKNAQNKKETELFASSTSFREGKSDAKKEAQAYMEANWVDWDGR